MIWQLSFCWWRNQFVKIKIIQIRNFGRFCYCRPIRTRGHVCMPKSWFICNINLHAHQESGSFCSKPFTYSNLLQVSDTAIRRVSTILSCVRPWIIAMNCLSIRASGAHWDLSLWLFYLSDHKGFVIKGTHSFGPRKQRDRRFESH
jgi:hypothetical protein